MPLFVPPILLYLWNAFLFVPPEPTVSISAPMNHRCPNPRPISLAAVSNPVCVPDPLLGLVVNAPKARA